MENNIISIVGMAISVLGSIFIICNHKRIRAKCGRSEITASIDVEDTTPPTEKLRIKIPPKLPESPKEEIIDDAKIG
jgi:hypothetical protein